MNIRFKKSIIYLSFIVLSAVSLGAQNIFGYPSEQQWFTFGIEQYGRFVPVENNRLELEKAPFTLVLVMRGPMGILVNFSEDNTIYKGFLKNKSLIKITDQADRFMGMGEGSGNPDEMVVIDKTVPHYMYYDDRTAHRFSEIEERGQYIIARRVISYFTTFDREFVPYPVSGFEGTRLYLSLMYGEYDDDFNRVELQKEALQIRFINP